MNTLNSILKGCDANLGGLRKIYFMGLDIESITISNYIVTNLIIDSSSPAQNYLVEWQVRPNTAYYIVNGTIDQVGVTEWDHQLILTINRREASKNEEMQNILFGKNKWLALVQDVNNQWWLLGWSRGITATTINGGSGTNKADGSNYEITISGIQKELELLVDSTLAESLIQNVY